MAEILIKKIVFYNMGHNGDIHYSKEFVKDIMSQIKNVEYEYRHKCSKKILKDISNIDFNFFNLEQIYNQDYYVDRDTLYINTWIGSSNCKYIPGDMGCSLNANYLKYKELYNILNLLIKNKNYYIPEINWNCFDIQNIDNFIENDKIYCLISNGDVLSGQALNFNFNPIIEKLSDNFSNINFILTNNKEKLKKTNIFYTDDIIKTENGDLNEIGYLGTKCKIIVGRASGPFCFCHNKSILTDKEKTLIVFSKLKNDGIWATPEENDSCNFAKQIWSNNFDFENVYDIIKNSIVEN